mmetsp:Transcript_28946/g.65592  ORF Transcript_28946/g.65592 Transcript_28946/m.65592 type:complete len:91 (+) Transcript_28946:617-889(+)
MHANARVSLSTVSAVRSAICSSDQLSRPNKAVGSAAKLHRARFAQSLLSPNHATARETTLHIVLSTLPTSDEGEAKGATQGAAEVVVLLL